MVLILGLNHKFSEYILSHYFINNFASRCVFHRMMDDVDTWIESHLSFPNQDFQ